MTILLPEKDRRNRERTMGCLHIGEKLENNTCHEPSTKLSYYYQASHSSVVLALPPSSTAVPGSGKPQCTSYLCAAREGRAGKSDKVRYAEASPFSVSTPCPNHSPLTPPSHVPVLPSSFLVHRLTSAFVSPLPPILTLISVSGSPGFPTVDTLTVFSLTVRSRTVPGSARRMSDRRLVPEYQFVYGQRHMQNPSMDGGADGRMTLRPSLKPNQRIGNDGLGRQFISHPVVFTVRAYCISTFSNSAIQAGLERTYLDASGWTVALQDCCTSGCNPKVYPSISRPDELAASTPPDPPIVSIHHFSFGSPSLPLLHVGVRNRNIPLPMPLHPTTSIPSPLLSRYFPCRLGHCTPYISLLTSPRSAPFSPDQAEPLNTMIYEYYLFLILNLASQPLGPSSPPPSLPSVPGAWWSADGRSTTHEAFSSLFFAFVLTALGKPLPSLPSNAMNAFCLVLLSPPLALHLSPLLHANEGHALSYQECLYVDPTMCLRTPYPPGQEVFSFRSPSECEVQESRRAHLISLAGGLSPFSWLVHRAPSTPRPHQRPVPTVRRQAGNSFLRQPAYWPPGQGTWILSQGTYLGYEAFRDLINGVHWVAAHSLRLLLRPMSRKPDGPKSLALLQRIGIMYSWGSPLGRGRKSCKRCKGSDTRLHAYQRTQRHLESDISLLRSDLAWPASIKHRLHSMGTATRECTCVMHARGFRLVCLVVTSEFSIFLQPRRVIFRFWLSFGVVVWMPMSRMAARYWRTAFSLPLPCLRDRRVYTTPFGSRSRAGLCNQDQPNPSAKGPRKLFPLDKWIGGNEGPVKEELEVSLSSTRTPRPLAPEMLAAPPLLPSSPPPAPHTAHAIQTTHTDTSDQTRETYR
ncbi:uncharacterized protein CLUP02_14773 [Colletotrichum lupini]|uniref:Uncharacterized protein n=1 Tax=Colletotrichum lupini TaxID=145971 RepID=A0A9Q8WMX2_9PEZI|nr:uncharacterized protein CLUP02_14773 [Colletotrichum lupini]UQC89244.1 hypothetical protein CLUP02_14773 [Colletotrichum lupini]